MSEALKQLNALIERCEEIGRFGDYDYSWWECVVWYDPQARIYYWYTDSGCSCSSFMDYTESISDLSFGRKEELTAAMKEEGDSTVEGWNDLMAAIRAHSS